jgi:hypothetical protein
MIPQALLRMATKLWLTSRLSSFTLTIMRGKETLITEMEQSVHAMVQGSLTEVTRQCGDPSCACATDPTRRHGPHLYLKFNIGKKPYSVYVLPEYSEAIRDAHRAWLRFQEIGVEFAAANRERFLASLRNEKQKVKAQRTRSRKKA